MEPVVPDPQDESKASEAAPNPGIRPPAGSEAHRGPLSPRKPPSRPSPFQKLPTTYGLIAFTVLIFIGQMLSNDIFGLDIVKDLGAKDNAAILSGELWRLITPIFIHVGVWHVFVNMYSLYALGPAIERIFGSPRMMALYLIAGINGVIFSLGFSPYRSVGASGAIFGLLGALGTFLYRNRESFGQAGRLQLRQILIITLLNLGLGLMPQIDNWGHLGGLTAGVVLTWAAGPLLELTQQPGAPPRFVDRRPWTEVWPTTLIALLVLAMLAFAAIHSPFAG